MGASAGTGTGAATAVCGGAVGSGGAGSSGCASLHCSGGGSGRSATFGACATAAGAWTGPGAGARTGADGCSGTGAGGATASGATAGALAMSAVRAATEFGATRGAGAGFGAVLVGAPLATRFSSEAVGAVGVERPARGAAGLLRGGKSRGPPPAGAGRATIRGSVQSGVKKTSRTTSADGRWAVCNRTTAIAACSKSEHTSETLNSRGEPGLPPEPTVNDGMRSE